MKKTIILFITLAMLIGLTVTPVSANDAPDWNFENSILVTVKVDEDKTFSPEDFPELGCEKVIVAGKILDGSSVTYELILKTNTDDIDGAMAAVLQNQYVTEAKLNEYTDMKSYLTLNNTELVLRVGEKADIYVVDFKFYNSKNFCFNGIIFSADIGAEALKEKIDMRFYPIIAERESHYIEDNLGDEYGESPINKYLAYFDNDIRRYEGYLAIDALNTLLAVDGITEATLYGGAVPGGALPTEEWTLDNDSVASISLSGGEEIGIRDNFVGQTATITGLSEGTTVLTLNRNDTDSEATATCKITVYMNGDINGDGSFDNLDASLILKHDAAIEVLPDEVTDEADVNGDGVVDNLDAALILKYDAGLI